MDEKALIIRIESIREQLKLTQQEVSDRLGISRRSYSSFVQGRIKPSLERLYALADIFGMSLAELLGEKETARETEQLRRRLAEAEQHGRILEEKLLDRDTLIAAQKSDLSTKEKIIDLLDKQLSKALTPASPQETDSDI